MAHMTRNSVTLTLSEDEFSALNGIIAEFRDRDPHEVARMMNENNMVLPINHAETLVKMWDDIHLNRNGE